MASKDIKKALDAIDSEWDEAEATDGFEEIPPGKYAVRIDSAEINHSKASGRLQCSTTMTVVDGKLAGRKVFKHDGLETAQNLGYFKTGLSRLGLEPPAKIKDLPDLIADEMVGSFAQITVKQNGEYLNIYFDKALDSDAFDLDGLEEVDDEEEAEGVWSVGDECEVDYDGTMYAGTVSAIEDDVATIQFEDGSEAEHGLDELVAPEEEESEEAEEEEEAEDIKVGDRVSVDYDGTPYEGVVGSAPLGGDLLIDFDDGSRDTVSRDLVERIDDAENEEEDGNEEEAGGVNIHFDDVDLKPAHVKRINKAAEACEYDPTDYESTTDLAADLAEYCGLEGDWSTPVAFLKDLEAALEE